MKTVPQEDSRLQVPRVFPETAIESLRTHIHDTCAELAFKLDEVGMSEWEDRVERKVIVPSSMRGQTIFHSLHRGLKHISVVVCISAGGDRMTPFVTSSQVNDHVIRTLKSEGFGIGSDMILRKRDKPYMNDAFFCGICLNGSPAA
jgi:hypothetical protein